MNFKKLQAMQAKLDEAIIADKAPMTAEERFNKTLVALSVEIAEVANCAEHFKFWKDNKGKADKGRFLSESELMDINLDDEDKLIDLRNSFKEVSFEKAHRLTLIEECSDALHFILSLANQMNEKLLDVVERYDGFSREEWYLEIITDLRNIDNHRGNAWRTLRDLNIDFYHYYTSLGITTEELEQAYYDKNKINYERLENGY